MEKRVILEGSLIVKLDDGRMLTTYVVSAEHAARVMARWEAGECGDDAQCAHGGYRQCDLEAGHEGGCK